MAGSNPTSPASLSTITTVIENGRLIARKESFLDELQTRAVDRVETHKLSQENAKPQRIFAEFGRKLRGRNKNWQLRDIVELDNYETEILTRSLRSQRALGKQYDVLAGIR